MDDPKFIRAANLVMRFEGGFSLDADDPGNWTGGAKGKGELVGTKFGISAAQYPATDIAGMTHEQARNIYWRDYWVVNRCDVMPPKIAMLYFDGCVNQGPDIATRALQRALGVKVDGVLGPITLAAARSADQDELAPRFAAERAWAYSGTKNFQKYGKGWFNRLTAVLFEVARI